MLQLRPVAPPASNGGHVATTGHTVTNGHATPNGHGVPGDAPGQTNFGALGKAVTLKRLKDG